MGGVYKKAEKLGSFRRFALSFWRAPQDGTIYGTAFIDATKMVEIMKTSEQEHGVKLTPGHFVGKGVAMGLRAAPQMNSKVIWGTIYTKTTVDIYFQVDVDGKDLAGVLIERADEKSIIEIAKELREKAKKVRAGGDAQYEKTQKGVLSRLPPFILRPIINVLTFLEFNFGMPLTFLPGVKRDAFGTAMVTNVGMMGIDIAYAPLIPSTRVGVIALVGRITPEAVVRDGKIEIRPILTGSATFDHRLGDGAQIGILVRTARGYMEDPHLESGTPETNPNLAARAAAYVAGTASAAGPLAPVPTAAPTPAPIQP